MTDFALGDHVVLMHTVANPDGVTWTGFKVALVNQPRTRLLSQPVSLADAAHGSDWANNLIAIEFQADDTAEVSWLGPGWIEVEGEHGAAIHQTSWIPANLIRGFIATGQTPA